MNKDTEIEKLVEEYKSWRNSIGTEDAVENWLYLALLKAKQIGVEEGLKLVWEKEGFDFRGSEWFKNYLTQHK